MERRSRGYRRTDITELLWALVATLIILYVALRWGGQADVPPLRITD